MFVNFLLEYLCGKLNNRIWLFSFELKKKIERFRTLFQHSADKITLLGIMSY